VERAVTNHVDLAPTVLRIAGLEMRGDFDGAPIPLGGVEREGREQVVVEYWGTALAEGGSGFGEFFVLRCCLVKNVNEG
jgi:N-acetylglucosamine-6-sulfatase